jgi:hypothetical protein
METLIAKVGARMCVVSPGILWSSLKAGAVAIALPLLASCTTDSPETESPYYSTKVQFESSESLLHAATLLKRVIEDECAMEGHERPVYGQAYGKDNVLYLFQSHSFDGSLRSGGILVASSGEIVTLSVELYLSGFDDLESLEACKQSIQDRINRGLGVNSWR